MKKKRQREKPTLKNCAIECRLNIEDKSLSWTPWGWGEINQRVLEMGKGKEGGKKKKKETYGSNKSKNLFKP